MKLIDIGANLSNKQFKDDLSVVLDRAIQNSVKQIVLTTVDSQSFIENLELCSKHEGFLFTTWGLHPHNAKDLKSFVSETKHLINSKSVKSIGEFGLDYFRMISTRNEQIDTMNYFLDISKTLNLPLFMHERHAHDDFCSILKEQSVPNKGVVHCFTGGKDEIRSYLDLDLYIGITGWICDERRNHDLVEAIKYVPLDKLMIETDSPYLKPRNIKNRNIRNEPAYLSYVLERIAQLKNIAIEDLSEIVYNNSIKFFDTITYE